MTWQSVRKYLIISFLVTLYFYLFWHSLKFIDELQEQCKEFPFTFYSNNLKHEHFMSTLLLFFLYMCIYIHTHTLCVCVCVCLYCCGWVWVYMYVFIFRNLKVGCRHDVASPSITVLLLTFFIPRLNFCQQCPMSLPLFSFTQINFLQ